MVNAANKMTNPINPNTENHDFVIYWEKLHRTGAVIFLLMPLESTQKSELPDSWDSLVWHYFLYEWHWISDLTTTEEIFLTDIGIFMYVHVIMCDDIKCFFFSKRKLSRSIFIEDSNHFKCVPTIFFYVHIMVSWKVNVMKLMMNMREVMLFLA